MRRGHQTRPGADGCWLVCEECGHVEPHEAPRLHRALRLLLGRTTLAARGHEITIYGLCFRCRS